MLHSELNQLTQIIETAIIPVALISGIGLLILAMTNRFAHITDRARTLSKQFQDVKEDEAEHISIQIKILYRRLKLMMLSIGFALASIFFISLLIIALFVIFMLNIGLQTVVIALFILSLTCLFLSLLLFISDIALSLSAIKEELKDHV